MMSKIDIVYSLLSDEADEKYYIEDAEIPAFLILRPNHYLNTRKKWVLYFLTIGRFYGSEKEIRERLKNGIRKAKKPIKVYKVEKHPRKIRYRDRLALRGVKQLFYNGYDFIDELEDVE